MHVMRGKIEKQSRIGDLEDKYHILSHFRTL